MDILVLEVYSKSGYHNVKLFKSTKKNIDLLIKLLKKRGTKFYKYTSPIWQLQYGGKYETRNGYKCYWKVTCKWL